MSDTIVKILPYRVDLAEPIKKAYFDTLFATQDNEAHRVEVQLMRGNTQIQLAGAQVTAYFIRYSDNATITLTGVVSGNVASVTLTDACYKKSGQFALVIKAKMDSVTNTVFYGEGTIYVSNTDIIPGDDSDTPAQDGGSSESGESVPWLVGSTDEITPTQVYEALQSERNVLIEYTDQTFGQLAFTFFVIMIDAGLVVSCGVSQIGDEFGACQLTGDIEDNTWLFELTSIATTSDIPSIPEYLPNPASLNIYNADGTLACTYNGSETKAVNLPSAGKTPVKGVDYWTDADQESIVQQVIAALGTPVFGYVDEENNIILTGNLTDETYTLKYEDAAGNLITIGTLNGEDVQTYVNRLKESIAADGSLYNGGKGWKADTRLNSSGEEVEATGTEVTGFMPFAIGDVLRFENIKIAGTDTTNTTQYIVFYDASFAKVKHVYTHQLYSHSGQTQYFTLTADGYWASYDTRNIETADADVDWNSIKYFRISAEEITDNSIITINQQIV